LYSVTNGRLRVSEFNDGFRAMNLRGRQSHGDPNPSIEFLQTGQSAKCRFCDCWTIKQTLVTSIYRPKPAGRVDFPISIVKASGNPHGCPVFGKQIDILTTSPGPKAYGYFTLWPSGYRL
ncbi:MAG: hypothetical protein ABL925_06640, partial [Methylococcales bacterium]